MKNRPHDAAVVELLKADLDFANEYLAAALEEADFVVVGDVHHPAQRGLGLGDDGIEPLAAVAHLHHALAGIAVFQQLCLCLTEHLFR